MNYGHLFTIHFCDYSLLVLVAPINVSATLRFHGILSEIGARLCKVQNVAEVTTIFLMQTTTSPFFIVLPARAH